MQFRLIVTIAALLCLFQPLCSNGQIKTQWITTDGLWSDSANWNNGLPFGNFNATIAANAGTVNQDLDNLLINGLTLAAPSGNLILDIRLSILSNLNWTAGALSGVESLDFYGDGILTDVRLETTFRNFGRMEIGDPNEFTQLDSFTANANWINKPGGQMVFNPGTVVGSFSGDQFFQGMINNEAGARMCFFNSANYILWDTVNDGVIEIGVQDGGFGGALFVKKFTQTESGEVRLNGGFIDFFDEVNFQGKITGNGSVLNLSATFDGELSPGGQGIGVIDVAGALVMVPETTTRMQIGGNLESDLITNAGGPLQLHGVLDLEAIPGATTGAYSLFEYNNGSGLDISNISFGDIPNGFAGSLEVDPPNNRVQLIVDAIDDVVGIENLQILNGIITGGTVADLAVNDQHKVEFAQNGKLEPGIAPISFVAFATLPDALSSSLTVRIDSSANIPLLQQQVALLNFDSGEFELIGANAMTLNDETVDLTVMDDASRFVDSDGLVQVRVQYVPTVRRNVDWVVQVDQLNVVAGR